MNKSVTSFRFGDLSENNSLEKTCQNEFGAVKVPLIQTAVLIHGLFSNGHVLCKTILRNSWQLRVFLEKPTNSPRKGEKQFLQDANAKARPNGRGLACILQGRLGRCLPERRAGVRLSGFREEYTPRKQKLKIMKTIRQKIIGATALLFALAIQTNGQNALQFTAIRVPDEGAIHLEWASQSNHVYQVQCADTLIDTNTGSITWNMLYNNYPSQGTNTFWLDTGNYDLSPEILHPKDMPMRFYRIVDLGPDTTSDEPSVVITSPTNNVAVSDELTVTVVATTDQPVLNGTKLYVDGQEMRPAILMTNYTDGTGVTNYEVDTYNLNTCEWGNETHTLFATAECESGNGDAVNSAPVATGHGVSPFVTALLATSLRGFHFLNPPSTRHQGRRSKSARFLPQIATGLSTLLTFTAISYSQRRAAAVP